MILPVIAYGDPVLKRKAEAIEPNDDTIQVLIDNMFDTMYNAHGVGLAAPQIGKSVRIFVVDTIQIEDRKKNPDYDGIKEVFINPEIIQESGIEWKYEEGCLSIPNIREDVERMPTVTLKYLDRSWNEHTVTLDGINARVVQHEFDHIEGVLFTDRINPLKKRLLQRKLEKISKGKVSVDYKMRFPVQQMKR
jgi:peptide deformylase